MEANEALCAQAERILRMAGLTRKLETERERVIRLCILSACVHVRVVDRSKSGSGWNSR